MSSSVEQSVAAMSAEIIRAVTGEETLPGFSAYALIREGFAMTLAGRRPDENGEPSGEFVRLDVIVPPLSFWDIQRLEQKAKSKPEPVTMTEKIQAGIDIIETALRRNYHGIPRWLIEQSFDAASQTQLNAKIREMSGVKPTA